MAEKNPELVQGLLYDRSKLVIMTALVGTDEPLSFTELIELTSLTKGNLSSHLQKLEGEGFVKIKKQFVEKKPLTTVEMTAKGRLALKEHIDSLQSLIKKIKL